MNVNFFYDWTEPKQYSADDEGNLVQLCRACVRKAGGDVAFAGQGHEGAQCELCDAGQDDSE
jgi:hypothetical protein